MKLLILTLPAHIYANVVINKIVNNANYEITIIQSKKLVNKTNNFSAIIKILNECGIKFVLIHTTLILIAKVVPLFYEFFKINHKRKIFSLKEMANKSNIKIFETDSINSDKTIDLVKSINPDLILSIYFSEILGEKILSIPKYGAINLHPAPLPNYKGVSPCFWVLANNEKLAGTTVHLMTKKVDEGTILEQVLVPIRKNDSVHSLYLRLSKIGGGLMLKAIEKMKNGKLEEKHGRLFKGSYYSWPSKEAIDRFHKNGKKFFSIKELLENF